MAKPRVYVETTIPSFYHESRTTPAIVARREWTRLWWDGASKRYELVTSVAVLDELSGGSPDYNTDRTALIVSIPLLPIEPTIAEIVQAYINASGDAGRSWRGRPALGAGVVSQMRFSGNVELSAPCQCQ